MKFDLIRTSDAFIWAKNTPSLIVAVVALTAPPAFAQDEMSDPEAALTLYTSLRAHVGVVTVDEAVEEQDATELVLSDAYSRVGAKLDFTAAELDVTVKAELGLNTTDFDLGDPAFFDDEDMRIYSARVSADWGSVTVGKDWLPYYNAVGYPVDYFSSIYAGYTTFAFFRERMIAYTSQTIGGVTGTIAAIDRTNNGPQGWQGTLTYAQDGLTLAAGFEEMEGDVADTYGASVSYTTGPWYLAAKFEDQDGQGFAYNGFVQRSFGALTVKAGAGLGDQYSGNTFHLGADYQLSERLKFFAEAYSEQGNYALLFEGADSASDYLGAGGFNARQSGKAILIGARLDLSELFSQ